MQSNFRWWYLLVVVPLVLLRFCLRSSSSSKYDYPSYNSPLYVPPVNTSEIPDLAALLDATSSLRSGQQSFREASATAIDLARQATDRGLTKVSTAAYAVDSALMARDCDEVSSAMTQLEAALKGVDAGESFADTVSSLKIEVRVACSASAKAPAAQTEKVFTEKPIRKN